jgi:hypothetical protein
MNITRGRQRTLATLHDWKMRGPQYSLTIHPARADQYLSLSPSPKQLRATPAACLAFATTALCFIPRQPGYRWLPLGLDYALISWCVQNQAGRIPLILSALRNAPLSFVRLPKLDVVGSSPIARSVNV